MGGVQQIAGCALALLLFACSHLSPPASSLQAGAYDLASLRSRLAGQEVELTPAGSVVTGEGGTERTLSAQGSLSLARDGSCLLVIDVRVDGGAPGHSERPCNWHTAGDLFSLADPAGVATNYRVRHQDGRVVLEDGAGERLVLEPQRVSEPLAVQRAEPAEQQPEADERGDRRP